MARQLATLDYLSAGCAAWNLVTSTDSVSGSNFRRGAYLRYADRYMRAAEALGLGDELWTRSLGPFAVQLTGDLESTYGLDVLPQRRPIVLQVGGSDAERLRRAARRLHRARLEAGRRFYADVKGRLAGYGRSKDDLLILPATTFVFGDSDADAEERAAVVRAQQVSGPTAVVFAEQLWNRDLSSYDPDGPLPDVDPLLVSPPAVRPRPRAFRRRAA